MAVIMNQTMPEEVPIQMLDAVTKEMDAKANPPAGLIVHVHYQEGGRVRITDVWESEQAYQTFNEQRLRPAMEKVAAANGMDISQGEEPETAFVEVQDVVRGS
jgi:hypothetical protein